MQVNGFFSFSLCVALSCFQSIKKHFMLYLIPKVISIDKGRFIIECVFLLSWYILIVRFNERNKCKEISFHLFHSVNEILRCKKIWGGLLWFLRKILRPKCVCMTKGFEWISSILGRTQESFQIVWIKAMGNLDFCDWESNLKGPK